MSVPGQDTTIKMVLSYRVYENEGDTENGYKSPKIGVLDHLFGISVLYTSESFTIFMFGMEFLIFTMHKTIIKKKTKTADFDQFYHYFFIFDIFLYFLM